MTRWRETVAAWIWHEVGGYVILNGRRVDFSDVWRDQESGAPVDRSLVVEHLAELARTIEPVAHTLAQQIVAFIEAPRAPSVVPPMPRLPLEAHHTWDGLLTFRLARETILRQLLHLGGDRWALVDPRQPNQPADIIGPDRAAALVAEFVSQPPSRAAARLAAEKLLGDLRCDGPAPAPELASAGARQPC